MLDQFPSKPWEEMSAAEQTYFYDMPEEDLVSRWHSPSGAALKEKIVAINLAYGSSGEYKEFLGTVKTDVGKKPPKVDLRGIDFSGFSNLKNDEIFGFDFSNCLLNYSDFSDSEFTSSSFTNSDVLYSDFSDSVLDHCDFSHSNLTLTSFDHARLEESDFRGSWLAFVSFVDADLGFIRFDRRTDFYNIDVTKLRGSSNPLFVSFIRRKHFLKHFKEQSLKNKIIYYIWLAISDCGQSFSRWLVVSLLICFAFGFVYSSFPQSFNILNGRIPTWFTFYYYSVVTFTTLGFGDVVPKNLFAEMAVTAEVILGYVMLGGLISIFATKFIPKG